MKTWKKALIFVLCLLPVGLIGGWFTVEMLFNSMDPSMLETGIQQAGSMEALKTLTLLSTMMYVVLSGFFGYILAVKIGLMRPCFPFRWWPLPFSAWMPGRLAIGFRR